MGLDIGLHQTERFMLLACIEKNSACCNTIRLNKENGHLESDLLVVESDIGSVDPQGLLDRLGLVPGELDLLIGGPPCQSFSTAGKRGTVQDPRGTLLWSFLRFVEILQPRFFLMENVRGLLSAAIKHRHIADRPEKGGPPLEPEEEPGSVVRLFAEDLQKIKGDVYHMDCFEVNAVNYGSPQLRERVLFIGNKYNMSVAFPDPTHGPPASSEPDQQTLFGALQTQSSWNTLGAAIENISETNPEVLDFSPRKKSFLKMVPAGSNWRSLPVELQKESMGKAWSAKGGRSGWWRKLSYDLPCPTLVTMPNHASTSLCHPAELRALSVREYQAIQEFPSSWVFCGTTQEKYCQIGNAVPIRLGHIAGEIISKALDRLEARMWLPDAARPDIFRIVYIQAHVRTRKWFKDGRAHVWKDGEEKSRAENSYGLPRTVRRSTRMK